MKSMGMFDSAHLIPGWLMLAGDFFLGGSTICHRER